jgi:hypothetical protein
MTDTNNLNSSGSASDHPNNAAGGETPTTDRHNNNQQPPLRLPTMASDIHRLGDGYSCAFNSSENGIECIWYPDVPPVRKARRIMKAGKYFAARDAFLAEVAARIGRNVLCINL